MIPMAGHAEHRHPPGRRSWRLPLFVLTIFLARVVLQAVPCGRVSVQPEERLVAGKGEIMFRMHAVFPMKAGARFDWKVYENEHLPLVRETLEPYGLLNLTAQRCARGPDGAEPANFLVATLDFESEEKFKQGFAEVAPKLIARTEKFTDIKPVFHFGEVVE